jgi:hypothetical protein
MWPPTDTTIEAFGVRIINKERGKWTQLIYGWFGLVWFFGQSVGQLVIQSVSHLVTQSVTYSVNQSVTYSVWHLVNQSIT